jgi:hypothetical protein
MGQQLIKFIMKAEEISLQAKMKIVMYTGLTTAQAAVQPDSPALVEKFESAMKRIRTEFPK